MCVEYTDYTDVTRKSALPLHGTNCKIDFFFRINKWLFQESSASISPWNTMQFNKWQNVLNANNEWKNWLWRKMNSKGKVTENCRKKIPKTNFGIILNRMVFLAVLKIMNHSN